MTGFFNDLDGYEPGLPDNTYRGIVAKSEIVTVKSKDNRPAWVLTFRVTEGDKAGEEIQEWFNQADPNDTEAVARSRKWRANRLESLGVPESQWGNFNAKQVEGERVLFGVKTKNGYTNVSFVKLDEAAYGGGKTPANDGQATSTSQTSAPASDVTSLM